MGRPPCCDKQGVKKGPWTPEEDILLVSYIQQHGPSNWRALPSHAGLRRCSKSCRLRWTNYLRPGIKRGNFTEQEEKMIIHLQALLGNRWAAIASYLPERTDNDIKNYWNTHLQKKLRKLQLSDHHPQNISRSNGLFSPPSTLLSVPENPTTSNRGQWERRLQSDIHLAKQALCDALSSMDPKPQETPALYASSTENIARLLQGWEKRSPKNEPSSSLITMDHSRELETNAENDALLRSLFGNIESESPNSGFSHETVSPETGYYSEQESKPIIMCEDDGLEKLSLLEQWLFDDDHHSLS